MPDDNQGTPNAQDQSAVFGSGNDNNANDPVVNKDTESNNSTNQDPFGGLVGEGKRYATPEDLAKSKMEADAFIEQLKRENAEMRKEIGKRPTLEDIESMMKLQNEDTGNTSQVLDEEALRNIVTSTLQETETKKTAQANVESTANKMVELFGEKAGEQVTKRAQEMGVTVDYLKGLAATSPKLFYATMGINETDQARHEGANRMPEGRNTEHFNNNPQGNKEGTWSYYEQLRKENPKEYFSPKVQNEIFKKRQASGSDFYK